MPHREGVQLLAVWASNLASGLVAASGATLRFGRNTDLSIHLADLL
jgi:hypothetical protein